MILNRTSYKDLEPQIKNLPVFYQSWYIDLICQGRNWEVIICKGSDDGVTGVWPIIKFKKLGFTFAMNPLYTPFFGPIIFDDNTDKKPQKADSFEKKVLFNLIEQLPKAVIPLNIKCSPTLRNWLPFYWKGFTQTTRYTYKLNIEDKNTIEGGYTSKLRNIINSADIEVSDSEDETLALSLINETLNRKDKSLAIEKQLFLKIDQGLKNTNNRKIFIAKKPNNEAIGCTYIMFSQDIAYLMFIGSKALQKADSGAIRKLIHYSIFNLPPHIKSFDFEGSMIQEVEHLFRSFGGRRVAYHQVSRVKNKWLRVILSLKQ